MNDIDTFAKKRQYAIIYILYKTYFSMSFYYIKFYMYYIDHKKKQILKMHSSTKQEKPIQWYTYTILFIDYFQ